MEPASVDFGEVDLGSEALRQVSLQNRGSAPATVSSWSIAAGAPFTIEQSAPLSVAAGESVDLVTAFRPTSAGLHTARIELETNAFDPVVPIDVTGSVVIGALSCTPEAVDLGDVLRGDTIEAEIRCVSTGSLSFVAAEVSGASPLFSVVEAPPAGELPLGASISVRVMFTAAGPQSDHEASLTLAFQNTQGEQRLTIPLFARVQAPSPADTAISLFLFWDTELTDMDLHLVRPGGTPFGEDGSDCYFQQPTSDWGTPDETRDDPFLDRDDLDGQGPENINLALAEGGSYGVYVHYYADNRTGSSRASVEVHAAGTLLGVFDHTLDCDDLWEVGTIQWDGASGSFVPGADAAPAGRGLCF